jgi:hypothetical protein
MKNMRRVCSAATAVVLTSSVAIAGEFYVGFSGGVTSPYIKSTVNDPGGFDKMSMDLGKNGFLYGVHGGWRMDVANGFHGLEASLKDSSAKGDFDMGGGDGGGYKINESYDISYKGGYEFATKTFLTGRLGVGQLRASHSIIGDWDIRSGTFKDTLNYFLAGLGVEHRMDAKYSITAEYLYRGAEDMKKRHMYTDGSGDWTDIKGEYSDHSFMIGINYFF